VLLGAVTYAQGRGFKGSLSWQPNGKILSALDSTFGLAWTELADSLHSEPFKSFAEARKLDISTKI